MHHRKDSAGEGSVTLRAVEGTVASPSWETLREQLWIVAEQSMPARAQCSRLCWLGRLPGTLREGIGDTREQEAP